MMMMMMMMMGDGDDLDSFFQNVDSNANVNDE